MIVFFNILLIAIPLVVFSLAVWYLWAIRSFCMEASDIIVPTTFVVSSLAIALSFGIYLNGFHHVTGKGSHLGYISSTETNGIFIKTPRVYFKTSLRSSQEDKYCVANMELYKKLGSLTNENVEIQYTSYFSNGIKNCQNEDAVVTGFKVIIKGKE